ncbi:MAG: DUF445 domain-containing protein [Epsilonproteobacteria bacterium]|nr:MAG: DUF445 domain-containing protein [Campylobacterota bacterium]
MNKSLATNLVAFLIVMVGLVFENNIILTVGLFALSGAVTNWLAIHMLFEKVPFLYGSGVVENRFEQFKVSIHSLIMEQFFTKENLQKFFKSEFAKDDKKFDFTNLINGTDFSIAFESLKSAVMESSFGGMLGMFGGEQALTPLKEPFEEKMKKAINEIVHTDTFQTTLQKSLGDSDISDDIYSKIDTVVEQRLNELNPKMVKELVQTMIKEHLGWLVIWGGVFGGVIGLVGSMVL